MRLQLLGSINKDNSYESAIQNPESYINLFVDDRMEPYNPEVEAQLMDDIELTKRESFLYIDEEAMQKYLFFRENNGFKLYKVLPNVEESKLFHWKERWMNKKAPYSRGIWCQLETPLLKFNILYYLADGTARISAGMKLTVNTVDHINVTNATNEKLVDVINDYITSVKAKAESMQLIKETDAE